MKLFDWQWLVVSSLMVGALAAAETRPQYGGILRLAMRAAPASLDPAELDLRGNAQTDSFARRSLTGLMFDTLVTSDANGRIEPALATAWQAAQGSQRWQFQIRRGVKFHDGTPLTAEIAAASLRSGNPSWKVLADGDSIVIERDRSDPGLLAELALPRNAITKRNPEN